MGDTSAASMMRRGCREAESTPGRGINKNFTEPGSETKRPMSMFGEGRRVGMLEGEIRMKVCDGRRGSWTPFLGPPLLPFPLVILW